MGFVGTALGVIAAWLLLREHLWALAYAAVALTAAVVCTWGVMHNQAVKAAKRRPGYRGGFFDLTEQEVASVGDKVALANMLATIALLILLIIALIKVWW